MDVNDVIENILLITRVCESDYREPLTCQLKINWNSDRPDICTADNCPLIGGLLSNPESVKPLHIKKEWKRKNMSRCSLHPFPSLIRYALAEFNLPFKEISGIWRSFLIQLVSLKLEGGASEP
jgi:hypothetical protein